VTDPATHPVLAGLLAAVLDEPERDDVRLVYADWLQEHGDEADAPRGEFIRVQCDLRHWPACRYGERDRPGCPCEGCALRRREQELLGAHGEDWAAALARTLGLAVGPGSDGGRYDRVGWGCVRVGEWPDPTFVDLDWRRGFVDAVTLTAAAWLANASAILAAQPVTRVTLTTDPRTAETGWLDITKYGDGYDRVFFNERWKRVKFVLPRAARS
jgi:uncharacterized protein (TIGR02996 family)